MRCEAPTRPAEVQIRTPYLVFVGDARDALAAKTGQGIVDWRPEHCVGQLRFEECGADLGIPDMSITEARAAGADTLVIGIVNPGGVLPEPWIPSLVEAMRSGLDIASGMHNRLADHPTLLRAAHRHGRQLHDLRHNDQQFSTGSGRKRSGRRLLTVGTDCSVGKKYAALALEREMRERGMNAEFRATGQTGILIAGSGIAIDAVVADFIAGAAESLSPEAAPDHWDVIEGQGSLFHPSFAGVTLGLLHGSQPDAFVVCHEPTRSTMRNVGAPMPSIRAVIEQTLTLGRLTNPEIRCVGIAINTSRLEEAEARVMISQTAAEQHLPVCDPVRFGPRAIIDRLNAEFPDADDR